MTKPRTHDENRGKVCLLCLRKDTRISRLKYSKILPKGKLESMINKHVKYNALDNRLPNAICDVCRRKLYRIEKGSIENVNIPNLKQFFVKKIYTRTTQQKPNKLCDCKLCQIANASLIESSNETKVGVINRRRDQRRTRYKLKSMQCDVLKLNHFPSNIECLFQDLQNRIQ